MDPYQMAFKKVRRKRRFIIHATVFLFGSLALFAINFFLIHTYEPWFIIPVGIWAIVLAVHGFFTFTGILSKEWEEKEIEKEVQRMTSDPGQSDSNEKGLELPNIKKPQDPASWNDNDFV